MCYHNRTISQHGVQFLSLNMELVMVQCVDNSGLEALKVCFESSYHVAQNSTEFCFECPLTSCLLIYQITKQTGWTGFLPLGSTVMGFPYFCHCILMQQKPAHHPHCISSPKQRWWHFINSPFLVKADDDGGPASLSACFPKVLKNKSFFLSISFCQLSACFPYRNVRAWHCL